MTTYKGYEIHKTPDNRYNIVRPNGSFLRPLRVTTLKEAKAQINADIDGAF
jgi:hypothetical protein